MTREFIEYDNFQSVGPGQKATLDLPVGALAVHELVIRYGTDAALGPTRARMEMDIERIRISLNGRAQREFTPRELFAINAYRGKAAQNGQLPIFFSEDWRRTPAGEEGMAWRLGDVDTFQVEVFLASDASAPTLGARLEFQPVTAENFRSPAIVKWRRFNFPVTATGEMQQMGLPKQDAYQAIHCFSPHINNVRVETDGKVWWDLTAIDAEQILRDKGWSPQSGLYHIDFARTGRADHALPMVIGQRRVGVYKINFDMAAASSFDALVEVFGPRD